MSDVVKDCDCCDDKFKPVCTGAGFTQSVFYLYCTPCRLAGCVTSIKCKKEPNDE